MQDRYTGDIGDFGKYGLLRFLCGRDLKLGVNWYLTPDRGNQGDGRFIRHLKESSRNHKRFASCDIELYDKLKGIVFPDKADSAQLAQAEHERKNCPHCNCPGKSGTESCLTRRCVFKVENRDVLPSGTKFYNNVLLFPPGSSATQRTTIREDWVEEGLDKLRGCDVVFFDPDNGLEVNSASKTSVEGKKYVFIDEIRPFYARGQSLVIYQHRDRRPEKDYIARLLDLIAQITQDGKEQTSIMTYHRFNVRDLIVIPHHESDHASIFEERLKGMMETRWQKHFSEKELP